MNSNNNNEGDEKKTTNTNKPKGQQDTNKPKGQEDTNKPKGQQYTNKPKGQQDTNKPKGQQDTNKPKGQQDTNKPKGQQDTNKPKGQQDTNKPKGQQDTNKPKGQQGTNKPKGQQDTNKPKGCRIFTSTISFPDQPPSESRDLGPVGSFVAPSALTIGSSPFTTIFTGEPSTSDHGPYMGSSDISYPPINKKSFDKVVQPPSAAAKQLESLSQRSGVNASPSTKMNWARLFDVNHNEIQKNSASTKTVFSSVSDLNIALLSSNPDKNQNNNEVNILSKNTHPPPNKKDQASLDVNNGHINNNIQPWPTFNNTSPLPTNNLSDNFQPWYPDLNQNDNWTIVPVKKCQSQSCKNDQLFLDTKLTPQPAKKDHPIPAKKDEKQSIKKDQPKPEKKDEKQSDKKDQAQPEKKDQTQLNKKDPPQPNKKDKPQQWTKRNQPQTANNIWPPIGNHNQPPVGYNGWAHIGHNNQPMMVFNGWAPMRYNSQPIIRHNSQPPIRGNNNNWMLIGNNNNWLPTPNINRPPLVYMQPNFWSPDPGMLYTRWLTHQQLYHLWPDQRYMQYGGTRWPHSSVSVLYETFNTQLITLGCDQCARVLLTPYHYNTPCQRNVAAMQEIHFVCERCNFTAYTLDQVYSHLDVCPYLNVRSSAMFSHLCDICRKFSYGPNTNARCHLYTYDAVQPLLRKVPSTQMSAPEVAPWSRAMHNVLVHRSEPVPIHKQHMLHACFSCGIVSIIKTKIDINAAWNKSCSTCCNNNNIFYCYSCNMIISCDPELYILHLCSIEHLLIGHKRNRSGPQNRW